MLSFCWFWHRKTASRESFPGPSEVHICLVISPSLSSSRAPTFALPIPDGGVTCGPAQSVTSDRGDWQSYVRACTESGRGDWQKDMRACTVTGVIQCQGRVALWFSVWLSTGVVDLVMSYTPHPAATGNLPCKVTTSNHILLLEVYPIWLVFHPHFPVWEVSQCRLWFLLPFLEIILCGADMKNALVFRMDSLLLYQSWALVVGPGVSTDTGNLLFHLFWGLPPPQTTKTLK